MFRSRPATESLRKSFFCPGCMAISFSYAIGKQITFLWGRGRFISRNCKDCTQVCLLLVVHSPLSSFAFVSAFNCALHSTSVLFKTVAHEQNLTRVIDYLASLSFLWGRRTVCETKARTGLGTCRDLVQGVFDLLSPSKGILYSSQPPKSLIPCELNAPIHDFFRVT